MSRGLGNEDQLKQDGADRQRLVLSSATEVAPIRNPGSGRYRRASWGDPGESSAMSSRDRAVGRSKVMVMPSCGRPEPGTSM